MLLILIKGILSKEIFSPKFNAFNSESTVLIDDTKSPSENSYLLDHPVGVYLNRSIITQCIQHNKNTNLDLSLGFFEKLFGPILLRTHSTDYLTPSENSYEIL